MRAWELTGVPFTSMKEPGGIADAIRVLRSLGLARRLERVGVVDAGDLELEPPDGRRERSGILNPGALAELVSATRERVRQTIGRGRRSLLVGGDCPVLLGPLAAVRESARGAALVMVDGHEDAWPPRLSATGEASDSELAIALGRVSGLPRPLARLTPLVDPSRVALLGPRDGAEIAAAKVQSVRGEVAYFLSDSEIGKVPPADAMAMAVGSLGEAAFWLHLDLDALSPRAFAAVDYPQPGGLDWNQLDELASRAASDSRCCGMSVAIYNPDLDPDRSEARKLNDFLSRLVEGLSPAAPTA